MMEYKKVRNKAVYEVRKFVKTQRHIVIVEDDRFSMGRMLSAFTGKYLISVFESAEDAAYFVDQNAKHIDLIITTHELNNSEERIWNMITQIKANESLKHIPIILQRDTYGLSQANKADIAAFITKPYDSCDIAKIVKKVLRE